MRIIAGSLRGLHFEAPSGHKTHPMSDKARGALFSVLGDISGLTVLDGFAGSGALSLEAISRGAGSAVAIDEDKNAIKTIKRNVAALSIEPQIKITQANVSSWSDRNSDAAFDLVLCDPPYERLQIALLQKLVRHVTKGGLFVLSWPGNIEVPEFVGLNLLKSKQYGDAQLVFFQRS